MIIVFSPGPDIKIRVQIKRIPILKKKVLIILIKKIWKKSSLR